MGLTREVAKKLWAEQFKTIRRPPVIFDEAVRALNLEDRSQTHVREHFSDILQSLMDHGLTELKSDQARAINRYLVSCWQQIRGYEARARKLFQEAMDKGKKPHEQILTLVAEVLSDLPPDVIDVILSSLTNQNRKRAGTHMESSMAYLFKKSGLRFERQKPKRSDFVFPDLETYRTRPERSVIVSAKHTIAERWKQVKTEDRATRHNVFLATMETKMTPSLADTIGESGIILYLPPKQFEKLSSKPNVRNLDGLVRDIEGIVPEPPQTTID